MGLILDHDYNHAGSKSSILDNQEQMKMSMKMSILFYFYWVIFPSIGYSIRDHRSFITT